MQKFIKGIGTIFIVMSIIGSVYIGYEYSWIIAISAGFISVLQGALVIGLGEVLEHLQTSNEYLFKLNSVNKNLQDQNEILKKMLAKENQ